MLSSKKKGAKKKGEGNGEGDGGSEGQNMDSNAARREERRHVDSDETQHEKAVHVLGVKDGTVNTALTAANVEGGMGNTTINIVQGVISLVGRPIPKIHEASREAMKYMEREMDKPEDQCEREPQKTQKILKDEKLSSQQVTTNAPADIGTIFKAVRQGKRAEVKRLLSSGVVDVNCRGEKGRTLVMQAAWSGHVDVFNYLVQRNCDLLAIDDDNNNVFHYACLEGSAYIVKMLLDKHKLDIECRGRFGRTPLMCAVEMGNLSVVEMLKKEEADFNTVDYGNSNILHMACLSGDVDMLQYVLSLNITDIECRGRSGKTPLMLAVEEGHMSVVEILKKKGADLKKDQKNNNILHLACLGGHVDMVEYVLLLNITDIECRGRLRRTPLMCAVERGNLSVVEMLMKKGADFKIVDGKNCNILHVACIGGHVDMVKHLVSLEELRGFEGRKDKDGRTPLQVAQVNSHDDVVSFLQSGINSTTK